MADSRHLAGRAKEEAESYRNTYGVEIPAKVFGAKSR
jgi:20S proteasome alpha/beta subunit